MTGTISDLDDAEQRQTLYDVKYIIFNIFGVSLQHDYIAISILLGLSFWGMFTYICVGFLKNEEPDPLLQRKDSCTGKGKSFNREPRETQPKKKKKSLLTMLSWERGDYKRGGKIRMAATATERCFPPWSHLIPHCSSPDAFSELWVD